MDKKAYDNLEPINIGKSTVNTFKYYRDMNEEEKQERIERAKNDSSKTRNSNMEDANYKEGKHKIGAKSLGCKMVATFLAGAIIATGIGIGIKKTSDKIAIYDALSSSRDIVSSETFMNSNGYVIYNERNVAIKMLAEEDLDLAIYGVYNAVSSDDETRISEMNVIMKEMSSVIANNPEYYSGFPQYNSFTEYLSKKGFVDELGNVYTGLYEKQMNDYALATSKLNSVKDRFDDNTGKSMK